MSKVSIITTTYKHERFIAQTINSLLNQSFTDWELLIGDDSPDDATWSIIQEYVQKYPEKIRAWHHSPNKGIVGNTNFLLEHISEESEFVAFLEGDDLYTPDNLEKKLDIFQKYKEVQLVYSDLSFVNEEGIQMKKSFYDGVSPFSGKLISLDEYILSMKSIFSYSSMMVRRGTFEYVKIRDVEGLGQSSVSDYDFVGQILSQFPVYFLGNPLTQYRIHSDNFSLGSPKIAESMKVLLDFYFRESFISQATYIIASARTYNALASGYILLGERRRAMALIIQALRLAPGDQLLRKLKPFIALFFPTSFTRKQFYSRFSDTNV